MCPEVDKIGEDPMNVVVKKTHKTLEDNQLN